MPPHGRLSTPSSCTTECSICTRPAAGTDDLRGAYRRLGARQGHQEFVTERDGAVGSPVKQSDRAVPDMCGWVDSCPDSCVTSRCFRPLAERTLRMGDQSA